MITAAEETRINDTEEFGRAEQGRGRSRISNASEK
jgi:hypothetical protein